MLSEGHVGKDDVLALRNGHLVMFLDRESYERTGLVGQPHGTKGSRGLRSRWGELFHNTFACRTSNTMQCSSSISMPHPCRLAKGGLTDWYMPASMCLQNRSHGCFTTP